MLNFKCKVQDKVIIEQWILHGDNTVNEWFNAWLYANAGNGIPFNLHTCIILNNGSDFGSEQYQAWI